VNSDHARALAAPACRSDDRKISISQMSNLDLVRSKYSKMDCQSVRSCVQWDPTAMPTACGCFRSGLQLDGRTTYLNNASYQLRVVFIGCTGLEPHSASASSLEPDTRLRGGYPDILRPAHPRTRGAVPPKCCRAHIRHLVRVWSVSVSDVGFCLFAFPPSELSNSSPSSGSANEPKIKMLNGAVTSTSIEP
jgi:hypothetical protein